ncbi:hypothetical protein V7247_29060 [Priestia megaterium]|uniref:hypothetical protein n=1 Tax=Priestia megaterium TaxID=1404 RepID=UPI002FFD725B
MSSNSKTSKKQKEIESQSPEKESIMEGLSLSLTFFLGGLFLLLSNNFLNYKTLTLGVSILLFLIAIIGFAIEISKTIDKSINSREFGTYIFVGALFILITYVLNHYIDIWIVNLIGVAFLLIGLYSLILGLVNFVRYIIALNRNHSGASKIIFLIISQILTLASALAAIFEALGIKVDIFK